MTVGVQQSAIFAATMKAHAKRGATVRTLKPAMIMAQLFSAVRNLQWLFVLFLCKLTRDFAWHWPCPKLITLFQDDLKKERKVDFP